MKKRLNVLIIGCLSLFIIIFLICSPTIFQEGNPLPVGYGIIKLLATGDGYSKIGEHKYIVNSNEKDINNLQDYLARNNLTHVQQMGAAHFFKDKQGNSYTATSRMYTTAFQVWDFNDPVNRGFKLP